MPERSTQVDISTPGGLALKDNDIKDDSGYKGYRAVIGKIL